MTRQGQKGGDFDESRLDDYVDVNERIRRFYEEHPDGRLTRLTPEGELLPWEVREIAYHADRVDNDTGAVIEPNALQHQTFIVYTVLCYRTPDDRTPTTGTAWEPFPGTTPYTRRSELMNAETAAWGRAIVAAGILAHKEGVASKEEVRNRAAERQDSDTPNGDGAAAAAGADRLTILLAFAETTPTGQGIDKWPDAKVRARVQFFTKSKKQGAADALISVAKEVAAAHRKGCELLEVELEGRKLEMCQHEIDFRERMNPTPAPAAADPTTVDGSAREQPMDEPQQAAA